MKPLKLALVAFAALVSFASITTPAGATLKLCQDATVSGKGRGSTGAIAFSKAKTDWRIRTEDAFGSYFAEWSAAENHARNCNVAGGLVYCSVWAQPCRPGSEFDGGVNKNPVSN